MLCHVMLSYVSESMYYFSLKYLSKPSAATFKAASKQKAAVKKKLNIFNAFSSSWKNAEFLKW